MAKSKKLTLHVSNAEFAVIGDSGAKRFRKGQYVDLEGIKRGRILERRGLIEAAFVVRPRPLKESSSRPDEDNDSESKEMVDEHNTDRS